MRCWNAIGRVGHETVDPIHETLKADIPGFSVDYRFELAPPAKPDVRSKVEETFEIGIWIDSVDETSTRFVGPGHVKGAACVTERRRALEAVVLPVQPVGPANIRRTKFGIMGGKRVLFFFPTLFLFPLNLKHRAIFGSWLQI